MKPLDMIAVVFQLPVVGVPYVESEKEDGQRGKVEVRLNIGRLVLVDLFAPPTPTCFVSTRLQRDFRVLNVALMR